MNTSGSVRVRSTVLSLIRLNSGVAASMLEIQISERNLFGRTDMAMKMYGETGVYPRLAVQMIMVGEESGRLEEMLVRVADVYDREVQMAVKRFLAVLEPALILGLAVLIGGIVFSILLGVMGMSELVA